MGTVSIRGSFSTTSSMIGSSICASICSFLVTSFSIGGAGIGMIILETSTPLSSFSSPRIMVSISFISRDSIILKSAKERTNSPSDPSESRAFDSAITLKKRSIIIGLKSGLLDKSKSLR